ncbi:MAG: glycosyltransferase family 39 protein [Actinobacteria bacterium]|nr:glycosyltransferase family 39 protein [Actinomycetota bacterium]
MMSKKILLATIILLTFFLRIWDLNFPFFTSDEARIAYRGYSLSHFGEDELGRKWPPIFNSSNDYQLPLVSYITAMGEIIPGPSDITARFPFILIGTLLVFTVYLLSKIITRNTDISLINAFLIATSPMLIFLSKTPNRLIVLVFLLTLFFLFLATEHYKKGLLLAGVIATAILMILTSKTAWFVIPPFTLTVLIFKQKLSRSKPILFILTTICLLAFMVFMLIPQGLRSLKENNFTFFSDVGVSNGINYLRGEGLQAHQSPFLEKILFNKMHFLTTGFLHWLSYFEPNLQFTQLDPTGVNSYTGSGAWALILIIPFFVGLIYLLKSKDKLSLFLLGMLVSLAYPGLLIASKIDYSLVVLCLPFIGIVISLGMSRTGKSLKLLFMSLVVLGVILNFLDLSTERIEASSSRPEWIKSVILEANIYADKRQVFISDDIFPDAIPFFQLYGGYQFKEADIKFPYLVRVNQSTNINLLLTESKFNICKDSQENTFLITKRDFDKIYGFKKTHALKEPLVLKTFTDSFSKEKVYALFENICLK